MDSPAGIPEIVIENATQMMNGSGRIEVRNKSIMRILFVPNEKYENMKEVDKIKVFQRLIFFQIIFFPLIDYFYMTYSHFKKFPILQQIFLW